MIISANFYHTDHNKGAVIRFKQKKTNLLHAHVHIQNMFTRGLWCVFIKKARIHLGASGVLSHCRAAESEGTVEPPDIDLCGSRLYYMFRGT